MTCSDASHAATKVSLDAFLTANRLVGIQPDEDGFPDLLLANCRACGTTIAIAAPEPCDICGSAAPSHKDWCPENKETTP